MQKMRGSAPTWSKTGEIISGLTMDRQIVCNEKRGGQS